MFGVGERRIHHQLTYAVSPLLGKESEQTTQPDEMAIGFGHQKLMAICRGHAELAPIQRQVDVQEAWEAAVTPVAGTADL